MPAFLQSEDSPDVYVKAFHLLRAATSHWMNGFTSHPLPADLAKNLTEDYVSMRSNVDLEEEIESE